MFMHTQYIKYTRVENGHLSIGGFEKIQLNLGLEAATGIGLHGSPTKMSMNVN